MTDIQPFEVSWTEAEVGKVLDQVRAYPFPPAPVNGEWGYGTDADYLRKLAAHWADGYDWRAAMAELNRYPQFTARIEDFDIHFVHVVGEAQGKRPLLISHGWPGSHYEFWDVIDRLAFPSRHGGDAADAFDLVIPSLPGFGFSSKPQRPFGQRATARLFNTLMKTLGYETYLAQGGDWGGLVTSYLGLDHGNNVKAIHLNMMALRPFGGPQTDAETSWIARSNALMDFLGGYFRLQVSKPQSLAWLAAGNPVGQAAWITERFHDWSDLRGTTFEEAFPMDRLLTNVMIYVMTGSFTTGAWYYRAVLEEGGVFLQEGQRCETPTAFANFPGEPLYTAPPRTWAERGYNIVRWSEMARGGHFAAMEAPDLFVQDVREWARAVA